jgi:hypothetical protein
MRSVFIFTVAVVLLSLSPLMAADSASLLAIPRPGSLPSTENLGFFATSITAGYQDPTGILPCWNCVPGAGTANVGMAAPLVGVESGSRLTIIMTGDDLSDSGQARFEVSLNSGGKTVWTDSVTGPVYPAIWLSVFSLTAPAAGRYEVQGAIRTGKTSSSVVTGQLIVF